MLVRVPARSGRRTTACRCSWTSPSRGRRWVVETDVADCFGSIPHSGLMSAVEERISDRRLLALLRAFLRAGVMEQGSVRRPVTGTPQGGVISPLLANVYLHRLDRAWRGAYGALVRYADDALVMCRSKGQAVAALARLTALLAEPRSASRSRPRPGSCSWRVGGEGVDFLGFHHRLVRSRARRGSGGFTYLARWPSRKADAARPRPHPVHDDAGSAGRTGRASRGGRSTCSCAAGRATSGTGTPPTPSTRSETTR